MISTELEEMADRLLGYAAKGRNMEPEVCACMAGALLEHARTVAVLETLPFDVTLQVADRLLEALPEWPIIRASSQVQP
jgi:hypothetical protein